jgi:hypothetical protein
MTDDLISRKAAIYLLEHEIELSNRALDFAELVGTEREKFSWGLGLLESIAEDIKQLPSAQPEHRWIPCSERLPERGVSVLISHVGYVSEDYLDIDDGAMYFWNSGIDLDEELNNLAWMPLPAPWRGEDDGNN